MVSKKQIKNIGDKPVNKDRVILTLKQKRVIELMAENNGKTKREIIKEAGYSKDMQNNPQRVLGAKAIVQAFEEGGITDEYLMKKHIEHLNTDNKNIAIKALDMAYKIKGSYAPEKHEHTGKISLLSLFKK